MVIPIRRIAHIAYLWITNRHYRKILASGAIIPEIYNQLNIDLPADTYFSAVAHWVNNGWREERTPTYWLSGNWYKERYNLGKNEDPLLHFIERGWHLNLNPNVLFFTRYFKSADDLTGKKGYKLSEDTFKGKQFYKSWPIGRNPNPFFDVPYYIRKNPEYIDRHGDPLKHYMEFGFNRSFHPEKYFDLAFYNEDNPSIPKARIPQLLHYVEYGAAEGVSPNRFFDPDYYARSNQLHYDNPCDIFGHFMTHGIGLHLRPSPLFDPSYYAVRYPEYADTHKHPLLHYQEEGVFSQYYPCTEIEKIENKLKISVITPIYNTDPLLLQRCIHSVQYQAYPHWELCLVDDCSSRSGIVEELKAFQLRDDRIKLNLLGVNLGISGATRHALETATGDYVIFLDHDDELHLNALFEIAKAISDTNPDLLYSDEELINIEGRFLERKYKAGFNPELLLTHNYITHLIAIRRSLLQSIDPFSSGLDGAQDHDLILQLTEQTKRIYHIPLSLYRWRISENSTSANPEQKPYALKAGHKAVYNTLKRRRISADISDYQLKYFYNIHRKVHGNPSVNILIASPGLEPHHIEELKKIIRHSNWDNAKATLIFPNTVDEKDKNILSMLHNDISFYNGSNDSGLSDSFNRAAFESDSEFLAFLGSGVCPDTSQWIPTLIGYAQEKETGLVGGRIAWMTEKKNNTLWFSYPDIEINDPQYFRNFLINGPPALSGHQCAQNVSFVSSGFCMIRRKIFNSLGGYNYKSFPKLMYDVDFSLRVLKKGYQNFYTPLCNATLTNSAEVDTETSMVAEKRYFQSLWREFLITGDPNHSLEFILNSSNIMHPEWLQWYAGDNTVNRKD